MAKKKQENPAPTEAATQASGRQLLFYAQLAAVNAERHQDWCVELGRDYAFARTTNSVPLTRVEFARAAREYPIVFAGKDQDVFPLAVLGLEDQQNLFVDDEGKWEASYLPAFVRRYPFVFTTFDEGQNFTLCVDEAFSGCNQEDRGERLFDDENNKTRYLDNVMAFLGEFQAEYQRTLAFAKRMKVLDLLEPVQANVELGSGKKLALTDFQVVSRTRLKQISDTALKEMFAADDLELVYQHLQSMHAFSGLITRLGT